MNTPEGKKPQMERQYTAPPAPTKQKPVMAPSKVRPVPYNPLQRTTSMYGHTVATVPSPPLPAPNQEHAQRDYEDYMAFANAGTLLSAIPKMRECMRCREELILFNAPDYQTLCGVCYACAAETYRPCAMCGRKRISPDEPDWKTKCGSCFKESLLLEESFDGAMRPCARCFGATIPATAPEWRTICKICFGEKVKANKNVK